jgi:polynucleotide 5'-kinase involved in rRNA processing
MIDKFFLPQLTLQTDEAEPVEQPIKHKIEQIEIPNNHEFRIQLNFNRDIRVRLTSGTAFLMGMELSTFFYYKFPKNLKSSFIYTLNGCTLDLVYPEGTKVSHYVHEDENRKNIQVFNLAELLECNRQESLSKLCFGPRIMLLGGSCSGKSTVLSILGNQAITRNWNPLILNLDPCGGSSDFPGVLSVKSLSDYWYQLSQNTERLSFFFGSDELDKRKDLYIESVQALMTVVEQALDADINKFKNDFQSMNFLEGKSPKKGPFCSGVFIDTPTGIQDFQRKDLKKFIDTVNPDYIVCIHCDKLKGDLEAIYKKEKTIILLEMSGGVSYANSHEKSLLVSNKLQNFFYSDWAVFLRDSVKFQKISVYKLDSLESLPLNYVDNQEHNKLKLTKIDPRITDLKGK